MIRKITPSAIAALCVMSLTACEGPGPVIVGTGVGVAWGYYTIFQIESSIEMEFNSIDRFGFERCDSPTVQPFSERIKISPGRAQKFLSDFEGLDANEIYEMGVRHSRSMPTGVMIPYNWNDGTLYHYDIAAKRGSAEAAGEIGSANLYCMSEVRQDFELAEKYLRTAADAQIPAAMASYVHMTQVNPDVTAQEQARAETYLDQCLIMGWPRCYDLALSASE